MPIEEGQEVFRPQFRQGQIFDRRMRQQHDEPDDGDRLMPIRSGPMLRFRDGKFPHGNVLPTPLSPQGNSAS